MLLLRHLHKTRNKVKVKLCVCECERESNISTGRTGWKNCSSYFATQNFFKARSSFFSDLVSASHHVSRFQPKNVKIILNESIPTLPNGATTYATYMEQKMKARMCSIVIHFWLLFGNVLNTTAYLLADTASLHLPQRVLCYSKFWHNKLVASTITAQSTLVYCRLRLTIGPTGSSSACKT